MSFQSKASRPIDSLVIIYDLQNFSQFFNQPDVHTYVPKYLNYVSDAIDEIIEYGKPYWVQKNSEPLICGNKDNGMRTPIHRKFLGDGELIIFDLSKVTNLESFIIELVNDFWNLMINFDKVNQKSLDDVPVAKLPNGIRFGIARGSIFELKQTTNRKKEYIGFPINLASRLQSYCRSIGLIASARIGVKKDSLSRHQYKRIVAKNISGFENEVVIVDSGSYEEIEEDMKESLFDDIN